MILTIILVAVYFIVALALELFEFSTYNKGKVNMTSDYMVSRQLEIITWPLLLVVIVIGGLVCGVLISLAYIFGEMVPPIDLDKLRKGNKNAN